MKIAAFDIGGTSLKMGVVTDKGEIVARDKKDIMNHSGKEILDGVLTWLDRHADCEGVAVSTPGYVDPDSGYIAMGGAIRDFDDFHLGKWLREKTPLPVSVENDANCALLAERWLGKAQEMSDFLMMTIGTGVGGAIFCNNALVRGKQCRAGEFGSLLSTRPGSENVRHYTMNTTCTMRVLTQNYSMHTGQKQEEITGEEIFARYDNNDPICRRLVTNFYQDLCGGIYNLAHVFNPQCIFLGGGITERESFLEELHYHLAWFDLDVQVDTATYGNDSGLLGAVKHFLQSQQEKA
ncbi:beta-glucoside kinase [Pantoea alhagi]|uniref:Beta-glucoside kinase n=1 Tax=Pantoea alhagi TaxID=1891675 RepID=A0A1W6BA08_9GAMM|nr:ROK family protein [Pantoea alhagi]ARJ43920.1 beta-glucoside kinase [Pantoea alhagi]